MDGYILKRKAIDAVYAGIKLYHNEHHPQKVVYDYILDVVGEESGSGRQKHVWQHGRIQQLAFNKTEGECRP